MSLWTMPSLRRLRNRLRRRKSVPRLSPSVEFMGKAQAPRKVRPPLVLISKKHIKGAKLILVHGRIVGLRIRSARSWLQAVGSQIAIPEELKLRVGSERISDERPKTGRA